MLTLLVLPRDLEIKFLMPGETDDATNNAASDNTSTRGSRFHEDIGASGTGFDFVADSLAVHVELDHVFS